MNTGWDSQRASFEEVVSQAAWVRRFAMALVKDPDVAADVAQETLTRAWQHPPQQRGPMRPWLATVVRNVVRSRLRSEGRRATRDQTAEAAAPAAAESAEDQLARWELFKKIVAAVESLSEPFRQTVLSRYFDGLTAAEIARRDGIPEATVRGRLKTGLDQLRGQLDDRHEGKRRAWVAILVPLLPKNAVPPPSPAGRPSRAGARSWLLPALAGVIVVGLALSWTTLARLVAGNRSRGGHETNTATASARSGGLPVAGSGSAAGVGNGEDQPTRLRSLAACLADVAALREKRRDLEHAMARTSGPHSLFRAGQPNPIATRALQPVLGSLMRDTDGQPVPFELTCRDLACRIEALLSKVQQAKFAGVPWQAPPLAARTTNWELFPAQTTRDALTGETVEMMTAFVGLRRQDGAAIAKPANDEAPWIPVRSEPPLPSDQTSCHQEVEQLQSAIALGQLALEADKNAGEGFAESTPNPTLTAELTPILRGMLARTLGTSALQVECRGRACRMEVPAAFAKQHPDWVRQMRRDFPPELQPRLAGSHHTTGEPVGHLQVIPPGYQKGTTWLRQQFDGRAGKPTDEAAEAHCRLRKEIRGTVGVEVIVTTGLLPHDTGDPGPIRFAQVGSLAGTAAGECMVTLFKERLQGVEVPGNLWEGSIEFEYEWK
jgi:RNA polymerase sigma factor (sigma-70 family)